jgi:uncharacterized membrane protein
LSHAAALAGRADWMPAITASVAIVIGVALALAARTLALRAAWLAGVAAVALAWWSTPAWLLFAAPAAINLAFGGHFGRTLFDGREPLIARYARREHGAEALPGDLGRYARRLTWLWTLWFLAAAVASIVLAATAPLAIWSAFANVACYVVVGVLFVGEYLYRRVRFRHYAHVPLLAHLMAVARDRPLARKASS